MNKPITIANEPGFDLAAAQELFNKYAAPANTFLLWLIPIATGLWVVYKFLTWLPLDEEDKQRKPFFKSIKTVLYAAIVATSISAILKIFGIA